MSHRKKKPQPIQPPVKPTIDLGRQIALWTLTGLFFLFPWIKFGAVSYPLTQHFTYFALIIAGSFIGVVIAQLSGRLSFPTGKYWGIFAGSALMLGISFLASSNHLRSWWGSYGLWSDGYFMVILLLLLLWVVISLKPTRAEWRTFLITWLVQGGVLALLTVIEGWKVSGSGISRANSPLFNGNYYISYLLLLAPFAIMASLKVWRSARSTLLKIGMGVYLILGALSLLYTVPTGLLHIFTPPDDQPVTQVEVSATPQTQPETQAASRKAGEFLANPSNTERRTQWETALKMGNSSPWFGVGQGRIREEFTAYAPSIPDWDYGVTMANAHNEVINTYATTGIFGLLGYLLWWGGIFWLSVRSLRKVPQDHKIFIRTALISVALYLAFNQLTFGVVSTIIISTILIALLATLGEWGGMVTAPKWRYIVFVPGFAALGIIFSQFRFHAAANTFSKLVTASDTNQHDTAIKEGEATLNLAGWEPEYIEGVARTYFRAALTGKAAAAEKAQSYADQAVSTAPTIWQNVLFQGVIRYMTSSHSEEALEEIQTAVQMSPYDTATYVLIRQMFTAKLESEKGIVFLEQLKEEAPEKIKPFIDLQLDLLRAPIPQ